MKSLIRATLFSTLLLLGANAQAVVVTFELDPSPNNIANDCVGYYNQTTSQGFDNCVIFSEDDDVRTDISSIISKWGRDENEWEHSGNYDSDDGDYTLDLGTEGATGSWSYTGPDGIRFWVAKSSTGFIVHYDTDLADCGTAAEAITFRCMDSANVVTGGDWTTPDSRGLSHISFYDSEVRVPEPGTMALLGLGLLGMGLARRRTRV